MKKNYFLITILVLFIVACDKGKESSSDDNIITNSQENNMVTPVETYVFNNDLIWSDEFDEDGAVSSEKWMPETIPPVDGGWYNGEFQFYTDRPENVIIQDGLLKIIAKKESYNEKQYTSARLITQDKFEFTYGKIEVRAKLPSGEGMWPAIWLLGANIDDVGWPQCGEIDILEHGDWVKESTVNNPGLISSAVHYPSVSHLNSYENLPNTIFGPDPGGHFVRGERIIDNPLSEFHVYTLEWAPDKMKFFVDGIKHHEFPILTYNMPFDKPHFIILNLAVGGHFTDYYIDPNFTEATFEIDYVRVYQ